MVSRSLVFAIAILSAVLVLLLSSRMTATLLLNLLSNLPSRYAPVAFWTLEWPQLVLQEDHRSPVDLIDPLVGTGGDTPNGSGGMIPSTAPPFAMTRWTAATRHNFVSQTPYNVSDSRIHGFQGTHQPAIWMGEFGQCAIQAGLGQVKPAFDDRGLLFDKKDEVLSATHYKVKMSAGEDGSITGEHTSTSRTGHVRYTYSSSSSSSPFVVLQSTRRSVLTSDPTNTTLVYGGAVHIDPATREISGRNPERQDFILGPSPASSFAGYFVARFSVDFESFGTADGAEVHEGSLDLEEGAEISGWARFPRGTKEVVARVGTSFISVDQARRNLDLEIPDGRSFEDTEAACRAAWSEKLDRIQFGGKEARREDSKWKRVFYTAFWHSLQYPSEVTEEGQNRSEYYSGYDDAVHTGTSYTAYSIWDTFRAEWPWEILFAPERIGGMVTSMLQDYQQEGWLPMWKSLVETNIMIGTHADSLIASCVARNMTYFDLNLAYEAVKKDADVPPVNDTTTQYADREENVGYEARAGLTSYKKTGWVNNEEHTEAGSRTLAYAYDDFATSVVARATNHSDDADFYLARSQSYRTIYNNQTGFMEARWANESWAGGDQGWTEGDQWCYTADVLHDVPGLIDLKGGRKAFVAFLDEHFDGGHNDHTNEPSHHIPYLYSLAGRPDRAADRVHEIAFKNGDYGLGPTGLLGNEDLGQMSAWFLFSSLGFYPVNPASDEYIIATPLFSYISLSVPNPAGSDLPDVSLHISAPGAPSKRYVAGVSVNGRRLTSPIIRHRDIVEGGAIVYRMSDRPTDWGT